MQKMKIAERRNKENYFKMCEKAWKLNIEDKLELPEQLFCPPHCLPHKMPFTKPLGRDAIFTGQGGEWRIIFFIAHSQTAPVIKQ